MLPSLKGALCRGGVVAHVIQNCGHIASTRQRTRRSTFSRPPRILPAPSVIDKPRFSDRIRRLPPPPRSAASEELLQILVRFTVPVEVDFGQTVKVVGNHPSLGSWDAGNGLALEWKDGHVWEQQIHVTPGEYEFKVHLSFNNTHQLQLTESSSQCVVVCAEGISHWEPGPNRVLKIEEGQTNVDVGCKWWHTGMNNIKIAPPFSFESGTSGKEKIPPTDQSSQKPPAPDTNGTGLLRMIAAGHTIPHIDKVDKQGEDAFLVSPARNGVIGLADGVSSWSKEGIDPSMYAKGLMKEVKRAVEYKKRVFNARESMMMAQNKNAVIGSSTCILAILQENILDVANVGDSQLKIIRDGKVVFSTKPQEHEFNCPYQLTCMDYTPGDRALNAEEYQFSVEDGDVLVMGSDGIFDNMWDDGLEETVAATLVGLDRSEFSAMTVANAIASAAHHNASDSGFYSPWTADATRAAGQTSMADELVLQKNDNPYRGGKMDDCTAVVAFITHQP